jgi:nucleoside 2-deoxyribosyltransferase
MNIYFSASVRGGIIDISTYAELIEHLERYGTVLTRHLADHKGISLDPSHENSVRIYNRDLKWLEEADVVVAEVSSPSHGQGWELAKAQELGKPVLCLYRPSPGRHLSAIIDGNKYLVVKKYDAIGEAESQIDEFLRER